MSAEVCVNIVGSFVAFGFLARSIHLTGVMPGFGGPQSPWRRTQQGRLASTSSPQTASAEGASMVAARRDAGPLEPNGSARNEKSNPETGGQTSQPTVTMEDEQGDDAQTTRQQNEQRFLDFVIHWGHR